jgi:hypothetical protein
MHILTSYSSFAMIVLGKCCGCVEAAVQDVRRNCCRNAAATMLWRDSAGLFGF